MEYWTFETVETRLAEAMAVLWRSGDRERAWLRGSTLPIWREVMPETKDASPDDQAIVTCALTRAEVMRADEAMEWIARWVPSGETRRIVGIALGQIAASGGSPDWPRAFERMGGKAGGWTADGLRKRYGRALTTVCERLNSSLFNGYTSSTPTLSPQR